MNSKKILGSILLLLSLLLTILLFAKTSTIKTKSFSINNPVKVPLGAHNFYNVTLEPEGKSDYHVVIRISSVNAPIYVDFWVVNSTWIGPLLSFMDVIFSDFGEELYEDYPDKGIFDSMPKHAREINITGSRQFELNGVNRNGVYCLVLINFYETTQYASVSVEERYLDPVPHSILEPNLLNILLICGVAVIGIFLVVKGSVRSASRAKLVKA